MRKATVFRQQCFYGQTLWHIRDVEDNILFAATTGVGKSNGAFTLGVMLGELGRPEVIVHVGIAGVYGGAPPSLGDIVVIERCYMLDEGLVSEKGVFSYSSLGIYPLEGFCDMLPLEGQDVFQQIRSHLPEGVYQWDYEEKSSGSAFRGIRLWYGSSCSVGMTSGDEATARERWNSKRCWIEEMETSGVVIGAFRAGIPIVAVRAISNKVGDRDKSHWSIEKATEALGKFLMYIQKQKFFVTKEAKNRSKH